MGPGTTRNSSINSRGNNPSLNRNTPKQGNNFIHQSLNSHPLRSSPSNQQMSRSGSSQAFAINAAKAAILPPRATTNRIPG